MKRANFILCLSILILAAGIGVIILFWGNTGIALPTINSKESSTQDDSSSESSSALSSLETSLSEPNSFVSVQQSSSQSQFSSSSQTSSETSNSIVSFPININTATKEEFMAIPEVDAETARVILEFRKKAGRFNKVEDLKTVLWKDEELKVYNAMLPFVYCE